MTDMGIPQEKTTRILINQDIHFPVINSRSQIVFIKKNNLRLKESIRQSLSDLDTNLTNIYDMNYDQVIIY